ncbi:TetR/AcrR family transcriptional regulator [Phreatobacter stygius]|uniref:TetR/AcrR family transcriptional regulator n=1 Tax=Phreatobacter stygius TaxID=1940610 RepID=A0A4D7B5P7_9HYPH|nr:TetR/AcrR family transcriptional regulator [Phreatobacter stygius]QCI65410.1 TetR/AcrR family transcriptional regulator [Phreatobacter stygius]
MPEPLAKTRIKPTSKEDILDAAERLFAKLGFDGASMREIAQSAGVAQALLHYHFRTKEGLFEAMFARRSGAINRIRLARLETMIARGNLTVEEIVDSLLRPTVEAGHDPSRGGHSFANLILTTGASNNPWAQGLIAASYDAMAKRYIAALRMALPDLSLADATWGYLFIIGSALTQMSPTGRADRLSEGATSDRDTEALLSRAARFAAAGLRAFAEARPRPALPEAKPPTI